MMHALPLDGVTDQSDSLLRAGQTLDGLKKVAGVDGPASRLHLNVVAGRCYEQLALRSVADGW